MHRIVICQSDEVPPQGTIAGSTARETRHPAFGHKGQHKAEQYTRGGFLPIFWDTPYSYIHVSTDIGEVVDWIKSKFLVTKEGNKYLAVLHNRNFASTEWVAGSEGAVLSRSVTSCAGMSAYLVLLAQTRVGFLSGGRGKSFHQLTQQEQDAQKEETFARARNHPAS